MKLLFINKGIFESHKNPVEIGEYSYIYIYIYRYICMYVFVFLYVYVGPDL